MDRRSFLAAGSALPWIGLAPAIAYAQQRQFEPVPGKWRTFEVTTKIDIAGSGAGTQAWVPIPAIDASWQRSLESTASGNAASAAIATDPTSGARMMHAQWSATEAAPSLVIVSRFQAQDRSNEMTAAPTSPPAPSDLASYVKATALMPTGGIVRATAQKACAGRNSDADKVRAIYEWIVTNTYREPTVRGCGVGDIAAMLETGNLGGKCADINALFVGLVRSMDIPARDAYGIRVVKSAFDYKELGAGSADITRAQHCRAEVWFADRGWVAMDPADVGKVMRQETAEWIKTTQHPIVSPVYRALWGGWEGNWLGYNVAHDVALPGSRGAKLAFLMYPQAEIRGERVDSLDPDTFKYRITAREITTS